MATQAITPSVGAAEPVVAGGASATPTDTTSSLSDSQLLDNALESSASDSPEPVVSAEGAEGAGEDIAAGEVESEQPIGDVAIPEELKAAFQMEGVGPKLRDIYYTNQAYREVFPTVAAARELKQLVPDVESAQSLVQNTEMLEKFDGMFYSDDPTQSAEFLRSLHTEDPEAFGRIMSQLPDVLSDVAPETYRSLLDDGFKNVLSNLMERVLQLGGDQGSNRKNAIDVVSFMLWNKPFDQAMRSQPADPREQALTAREKRIKDEESRVQDTTFKGWYARSNEVVQASIDKEMSAMIASVLKTTNVKVTDQARGRILLDAFQKVKANLDGNREFVSQVQREIRAAKAANEFTPERQQRLANLVIQRARPLFRKNVQAAVETWTKDVLGISAARNADARTAAARIDAVGGAPTAGGKGGVSIDSRNIDYRRTSDDDIINSALGKGKVTLRK